eukprot:TRINITY_DN36375_c0_g1_i1.p1 TRINITY_DN36375_c0_g1~~TRINITY_DN36375_c0_g1_i1.p1  ORF type:complete len:252 (+),score=52.66 TRINITY_DN36375_c0_g1_i1:291-1046(+)
MGQENQMQNPAFKVNEEFERRLRLSKKETNANLSREIGFLDDELNWNITQEDARYIFKLFEPLYRNRLTFERLKKCDYEEKYQYHPSILPESQKMANQYREKLLEETAALIENKELNVNVPENGKITHADLLVYQRQAQKTQHEKLHKEIVQSQISLCSFRPQINKDYESKKNLKCTEQSLKTESQMSKTSGIRKSMELYSLATVSYTHLTLPTICSVQISVVAVSLKKKNKIRGIKSKHLEKRIYNENRT